MEALYIVLIVIACFIVMHIGVTTLAAYLIYTKTLMRKNKDQWSRDSVSEGTPQLLKMDAEGQAWHEEHLQNGKEVHIVRDGFNLYGEYYDFGYNKAVMVLSGRTETLRYGYYFARPYYESGYNVLVVDPRAHGKSDGRFNTIGFEESKDALEWTKLLNTEYGINHIVLHGICIGAAGGMYAINSENSPEYLKALVAEGMFPKFYESMKNNLLVRKKNIFPILHNINIIMKLYTGHSMKYGPIDVMPKMKKPLLMLHSKEDKFSLPCNAQKLYDLCKSDNKKLVWFEKGAHSMLRVTDTDRYDNAIKDFLKGL